jgi:hypothetical protein
MGEEIDMDSKKEKRAKIKVVLKKYQSPVLIMYGKLSEITAGGTSPGDEGKGTGNETKMP